MNLVLLPGLNNTTAVWTPLTSQLTALGLDSGAITAIECSDLPSVEAIAADLLTDLPGKFYLCGFSFGGYVALAMQALAPERVAGLILVNTSAIADSEKTAAFRRNAIKKAETGQHEEMMLSQLPIFFDKSSLDNTKLQSSFLDMLREYGTNRFINHTLACIARPDSSSRLATLAAKTLVISAAGDRLIPPDLQKKMAQEIPGASYETIEKCGHMLPIERPKELAAVMFRWLKAQA